MPVPRAEVGDGVPVIPAVVGAGEPEQVDPPALEDGEEVLGQVAPPDVEAGEGVIKPKENVVEAAPWAGYRTDPHGPTLGYRE